MTQIDEPTIQPIKVKEKHMTNYNERLDKQNLLKALEEV